MRTLRIFAQGIGSAFNPLGYGTPSVRRVVIDHRGFRTDQDSIRRDLEATAADLRRAMESQKVAVGA